jgi:predicted nucleic acid-binding protein
MLVVDASAVVELLLGERGDTLERHVAAHAYDLHAPALVDVEVLNAVRRLRPPATRAAEAVRDLLDLPLTRYSHEALVPRIWELKDNFTPYDAAYVALAEALREGGVPLLTTDARLSRAAARQTGVEVLLAR